MIFRNLVRVFNAEVLSDNYYEYQKLLLERYRECGNIVNVAEIVLSIEEQENHIVCDSINSLSILIYMDGSIRYVACFNGDDYE